MKKEKISVSGGFADTENQKIPYKRVPLFGFTACRWHNSETNISFPYRLKLSKASEKQPLLIYLHGATAVGTDNVKQVLNALPLLRGLKGKECSILIPQAFDMTTYEYFGEIKRLAEMLAAENGVIDKDRIYLAGTSFGGCLCWRLIYDYPDFFACAMPVMGALVGAEKHRIDLSRIKAIPVWAAHSSNDKTVSVKDDDYCVSTLRAAGGKIKYTRWDKYGHGMSWRFYKKEKWSDWMFMQKK